MDHQLGFDFADEGPAANPAGPVLATRLREPLGQLAGAGIHIGTSSWKYPGWLGSIYDPRRYATAGQIVRRRFEQTCLSEYATVFPTVGGDFSFYAFPSAATWQRLFAMVPGDYPVSLKIPEEVTVPRFGSAPRFGRRAGTPNGHFMDPDLVAEGLLAPLEPYRRQLGVLMFEFGTLREPPYTDAEAFTARLDGLLGGLPTARFRFGVEVRNPAFLADGSPYLDCLRRHGVAHVLNSWSRMPAVDVQLRRPGVLTAPHVAARFLLKPGRSYAQAVEQFSPYETVQERYAAGRAALRQLIERCLAEHRTLFAYVNNRFEGNAPGTIAEVLDEMERF